MSWSARVPQAVLVGVLVVGSWGAGSCARSLEAAPAAPAEIYAQWPGCPGLGAFDDPGGSTPPPDTGSLPSGFVPVEAVVCAVGERTTPDGALTQVGLERRATDIAPLLTYLAQPSVTSSRPDELVCPAMAVQPVWLFLTDAAGRWVTPALPTDACGFPLGTFDATGTGLEQLQYRDTVVQQLRVLESPEAQASGCGMQWKNMVAVEADGRPSPAPIRTDPFDGKPIRVCVYTVPKEEQSSSTPSGEFRAGRALDRDERRLLLAALVGSRAAAASCADRGSRFAMLQPTDGGTEPVYVELDGCRRLLHGTSLASAGPDLVRRLETLTR